jgi:anion-transporting  ArsA/GET3 family ATPase
VKELNDLFGGFRERAKAVYEDLKGPDVAFVIVTSPAPGTVAEAIFFTRKLREYGITPRAMVVNRVHAAVPEATDRGALQSELVSHLQDQPATEAPELLSRMLTASADARVLAARDRQGLLRLRKTVGSDLAYVEVPAFERDVHDLSALARLSQYLAPVGVELKVHAD